ncbi:hypothetical protein PI125_g15765 [Phytophthora idaei]|nr:hypothetical protein PI125_g15765 [Phytophthora idaei]
MLRRHPTRVEERADVAAEYEAYLNEKESEPKLQSKTSPQQATSDIGGASESMVTRQEARRQEKYVRIRACLCIICQTSICWRDSFIHCHCFSTAEDLNKGETERAEKIMSGEVDPKQITTVVKAF